MTFTDIYGNLWYLRDDLIYGGKHDPDANRSENAWRILTVFGDIAVRDERTFNSILEKANIV